MVILISAHQPKPHPYLQTHSETEAFVSVVSSFNLKEFESLCKSTVEKIFSNRLIQRSHCESHFYQLVIYFSENEKEIFSSLFTIAKYIRAGRKYSGEKV